MVAYKELDIDSCKVLSDLSLLLYSFGYNMRCFSDDNDVHILIRFDRNFLKDQYNRPLIVKNKGDWKQFYVAYPGDTGVNFAIKNKIPLEDVEFTLRTLINNIEDNVSPLSKGTITPVQYEALLSFEPKF